MNKCPICNKKLKLTNLMCKCNNTYCNINSPPELHNCTFDYKKQGQDLLNKNNPKIISNKIVKI